MPEALKHIKSIIDVNKYKTIDFYYQDESRFGLKTFVGKCLSIKGLRPKVLYQHRFQNTYLWGSYSPLSGDQFVWEIDGVSKEILQAYLNAFAQHHPWQYKIIIMDNAGFHNLDGIEIPENISIINIPPYCPELNPSEQVWQYIKKRFKNKTFATMDDLKLWLNNIVNTMQAQLIKSITSNHNYLNIINELL